ncbi:C-type lectin domain family 12 member B-like isoform X2 [Gouania willdenowi]|uniref:C-type lectin domain family 12 member B-like isoform X2 n=1 Tax=Gouania willdenowi TaxID=441366 RepID=UPI001056D1EE|nr:C-type lectin domain family 12 member B-like isoform X2 [Gouania willdenowi]
MAEDELQYASVVFKSNKQVRQKENEEVIYADVKRPEQTTKPAADTTRKDSDSSRQTYQQLAYALGTLCVLLVLAVIVVCVYVTTLFQETEKSQTTQTSLLADNHKLTVLNINLRSDINNLTWACNLLESKLSNMTAEIQILTMDNLELMRLKQNLEKEKENLTEELIRTQSSEVNVSRAQWSIEAYCSEATYWRRCENCQKGWKSHGSSCYVIVNNHELSEWRSWNEAQDDCKRKSSDLVVIESIEEKNFVQEHSWESSKKQGYWIGVRAIAGKWMRVDGSELPPDFLKASPVEGQCVISHSGGWTPVSCDERNRWTCEKKALSI